MKIKKRITRKKKTKTKTKQNNKVITKTKL